MGKRLTLDRILQSQGFGTRKWCKELVAAGQVSIEGRVVTDGRTGFDVNGLVFEVYGETWLYREKVYIAVNKPANFECSRKPDCHPGILSILPEQFSRREVQPVGRLDFDTTGLLLLSDDGAFIHKQASPRRHVSKYYEVTTPSPVTEELVATLLEGVWLNGESGPVAAASCRKLASHRMEISLQQGKYHQVKRMLAAAGNHCTALRRTQIGGLTLDSLKLAEGQWCYLGASQLALLAPG
jgi:16S rRNA pseudouridine516 synthase